MAMSGIWAVFMFNFDRSKNAVCDQFGNKVLVLVNWTIDLELSAQLDCDGEIWNIIALQKEVAEPGGQRRLGWEVVAVACVDKSSESIVPKDVIARALKAFGYGNGRGHEDDVPVSFNLG
jgi:hypothetical protein